MAPREVTQERWNAHGAAAADLDSLDMPLGHQLIEFGAPKADCLACFGNRACGPLNRGDAFADQASVDFDYNFGLHRSAGLNWMAALSLRQIRVTPACQSFAGTRRALLRMTSYRSRRSPVPLPG